MSKNYRKLHKKPPKVREILICPTCGISFERKNQIHTFCSRRCFRKYQMENNPAYKILEILRRRLLDAIKEHGNVKSDRTINLTGCTIEFLLDYLQETAIKNGYEDFDIRNYSSKKYHIDHIIPCDSFDFSKEENQRACFHYTNLQILSAGENVRKWKHLDWYKNK